MGLSTAIIVGSLIGAASTVATRALAPKPGSPGKPNTTSPEQADKAARDTQDRRRKQLAALYGRSDTIATGPLGVTTKAPGTQKTLLGM